MSTSFPWTIFILSLLLVQSVGACAPNPSSALISAEAASQMPSGTIPRVSMPDTELRQLQSPATGRSYDIYVRLPDTYDQNRMKNYPVLYVLDGQWDFKLLDSIQSGLLYDKFAPEMIIVGITYSGDHPDYGALRAMDYTPFHETFIPGSGQAPKFFRFIKEQLLPFVEANYRTDPSQRVLLGSSFGGTFTLYALFTEPTLFHGYIVGSPIVTYGDRFAFKQEAEYASSHKDLPVRLFLAVGELEEILGPVQQFIQVLQERNYTGLEMETQVIAGERHAGNKPEAYNRGLRYIFQGE